MARLCDDVWLRIADHLVVWLPSVAPSALTALRGVDRRLRALLGGVYDNDDDGAALCRLDRRRALGPPVPPVHSFGACCPQLRLLCLRSSPSLFDVRLLLRTAPPTLTHLTLCVPAEALGALGFVWEQGTPPGRLHGLESLTLMVVDGPVLLAPLEALVDAVAATAIGLRSLTVVGLSLADWPLPAVAEDLRGRLGGGGRGGAVAVRLRLGRMHPPRLASLPEPPDPTVAV